MEIIQQDSLHVPVGFSIKSSTRGKATLVNASKKSDTVFEVIGCDDTLMNFINSMSGRSWVVDRTKELLSSHNVELKFDRYVGQTLHNNLTLISDKEPEVIAYALLYANGDVYPGERTNKHMKNALRTLIEKDPLNIGADIAPIYYKKRLKDFLFEFSCGMQVDTSWDTHNKINGGYILVTAKGDVMAYYASDQDSFKDWLIEATKFDTPSTQRHQEVNGPCCGHIHKENGKYYYTLSLQVKFNT